MVRRNLKENREKTLIRNANDMYSLSVPMFEPIKTFGFDSRTEDKGLLEKNHKV